MNPTIGFPAGLRVKKTARFIEGKCAEWIEMKKSETGHPWIRRR